MWRRVLVNVGLLSCGAAIALGVPSAAEAGEAQPDRHFEAGMQGGTGGSFGYFVKKVRGPVLLARNEHLVFDPASALKTLLLVYGMRQVGGGADELGSAVTMYRYPNSRNADGAPESASLCPNPADEVAENAQSVTLREALTRMMVTSDNRATRALELRYGRARINALAADLGMTSTRQDQIFGCGFDDGRRNAWTLADAATLYEGISAGTAVRAELRGELYGNMINLQRPSAFAAVVQEEADALGIADSASQFLSLLTMRLKGGAYDVCTGRCADDDLVIRDLAGILTVPFKGENGTVLTDYVFGSFIADLHVHCPTFPCASAERAASAVDAAIPEMFRDVVRSALRTWVGRRGTGGGGGGGSTPPAVPVRPATPKNVTKTGTRRPDVLRGGKGNDLLRGLGGNDRLYGGLGNDRLFGGLGNDRLEGHRGRDVLDGGAGRDTIVALDKAVDTIRCGAGRDVVAADRNDKVAKDCEIVRRR